MFGNEVYEALVGTFKGAVETGQPIMAHQALSVIALVLGRGEDHEWDKALELVGEDHSKAYKEMTAPQDDPEADEFVRPYVESFRNAVMFNQYGDVIRLDESLAMSAMDSLLKTVEDGENSTWELACKQIGSRYEPVFASLQSRFTRPQTPEMLLLTGKGLPALDFTK